SSVPRIQSPPAARQHRLSGSRSATQASIPPSADDSPMVAWALWQSDRAARLLPRGPVIDPLGRHDLNPEAGEADIGELGGSQQPDRGDAQILGDLGAEPDLAPLP